ncbi:methyltransferase [Streptomyces sp. NBC_00876]|nr:methyltransferase [Streptomyces sp. NBC_00876]
MLTVPGVCTPQHDTHLLIRALARENISPGTHVLELGTGSGALAVHAARLGACVTAVDISHRAVLCARVNAALHRSRVTVRYRDLSALDTGQYDMVISNPPYVPSPIARPPVAGQSPCVGRWSGRPCRRQSGLCDRRNRSATRRNTAHGPFQNVRRPDHDRCPRAGTPRRGGHRPRAHLPGPRPALPRAVVRVRTAAR